VLLGAKNIITSCLSKKFDARYLGPYIVSKRIGELAYKLDLLLSITHVHLVFSVLLLEPWHECKEVPCNTPIYWMQSPISAVALILMYFLTIWRSGVLHYHIYLVIVTVYSSGLFSDKSVLIALYKP
jgi:carbon starvation protein CstA